MIAQTAFYLRAFALEHVSQIGTVPVGAAFKRPEFAERYIIGFWEEDPHEPPEITFNEEADAHEIEYMNEWARKTQLSLRESGRSFPSRSQ